MQVHLSYSKSPEKSVCISPPSGRVVNCMLVSHSRPSNAPEECGFRHTMIENRGKRSSDRVTRRVLSNRREYIKQNKERGGKSSRSVLRSGEFTRLCIFQGCHTVGSKFWLSAGVLALSGSLLDLCWMLLYIRTAQLIWFDVSHQSELCAVCVVSF